MPVCEIHRCDMKLIPAGVSKKTGKPYNAFYACQVNDCTFRPPAPQPSAPAQSPRIEASRGLKTNSSEGAIIRQVAFKGAIEMAVAGKIDIVAVEKYTNTFESILLRHKTEPIEDELPTIQQDASLDDIAESVPF